MIVRNDLIEAERIEKPTLALLQPPHHRPPPQRIVSERRNHPPHKPSTTFCNKICHHRTRAAQQRTAYSISSSARSMIDDGTATPIALAVLRLTTNSVRVGCPTGSDAGDAPRRTRST